MMDRAGKLIKGILNMRDKALKTLLMGGMALSFTLATNACAQETPTPATPPQITYKWAQNPASSSAYDIARAAMEKDDIFKNSRYKKGGGINPALNIGEYNLDADPLPEIIAVPTEEEPEIGLICQKGFLFICPHYIIDGQTSKLLGIIMADRIDVDSFAKPVNGYRVLKATFEMEAADKKEGDNLLSHKVETYEFDKAKGAYEKTKTEFVPPPAPDAAPK